MNKILMLILDNCKNYKDNICIIDDKGSFTWNELINYAYLIAEELLNNGIKKQDCVSIELPNCKEFVASIIACQIIGAVYVPVGNMNPKDRVEYIHKDCNVKFAINDNFISNLALTSCKKIEPVEKNNEEVEMIIYTSGSTGKPKGVIHTVRSMLSGIYRELSVASNAVKNDHFAVLPPFSFILGICEVLSGLIADSGWIVYIMPNKCKLDPSLLNKYLKENRIRRCTLTPRLFPYVNFSLLEDLYETYYGGARVSNVYDNNVKSIVGYSSTELGGVSFAFDVNNNYENSPIGKPLGNCCAYLLDDDGNFNDTNGELCVTGDIACGYINLPNETKEHFIDNPFFNKDGNKKMFKTGDIAKKDKDGNIIIVGRKDFMVNINGQRVELEEIEHRINQIDGINISAIKYIEKPNNSFLVAYYAGEENISSVDIKIHLSSILPSYMIPEFYIFLDSMPMLPNGKVNRMALPDYDIEINQEEYVAPKNKTESLICDIFAKAFNLEKVGINDDFIKLGGDSLFAINIVSNLDSVKISSLDIINLRTPRLIAKEINSRKKLNINFDKYNIRTGAPLSESQLNIYLDIMMHNKQDTYLIPFKVNLKNYSVESIKHALSKLYETHPIIMSYIDKNNDDKPYLKIGKKPKLDIVDKIDKKQLLNFLSKRFDINNSLARFLFDKETYCLYVVFHHLIFDGFSANIFINHIFALLEGKSIKQDLDFLKASVFSEEIKKAEIYNEAEQFFEKEFVDTEDVSGPIDDIEKNEAAFSTIDLNVNKKAIENFVIKHKISKNILFTAVFAYTLSRFTNSKKSYFTINENGRDNIDVFNAIGMFVNTLPIIIDCKNDSIDNFIKNSCDKIYQTLKYNFYPFRELKNKYMLNNNVSFQYFPYVEIKHAEIYEKEQRKDLIADMLFDLYEYENKFVLSVTNNIKYSPFTVRKYLKTYETILNEFLIKKNLSEINYTLKEDVKLIDKINLTESNLKYNDILEAFNFSLKNYPNNVLVSYLDKKYTYREAAAWINALTEKLVNLQNGSKIAIFINRSHYYLLTAFSVLNSGCVYVPIDDDYPDSRIKFMLDDANIKLVLVCDNTISRMKKLSNLPTLNVCKIIASEEIKPLNTHYSLDSLAVILYTSGTTGNPKGSLITRKAILNFATWYVKCGKLKVSEIYALYTTIVFDHHIVALFSPCICGACTEIIPKDLLTDINKLAKYVNEKNIKHMFMTTQLGKLFISNCPDVSLKVLTVAGEALGQVDISDCKYEVIDSYGPTECQVTHSIYVDKKIIPSSVGHTILNIKSYVLDNELRQVPVGAIGELYVSGYQLVKGYLNREKENKEAFFDNPFDGNKTGYEKMYKTGDIVRLLTDGTFEFLGRKDSQVKIRGNRVELSEVENAIRGIKEIKDVTVQAFHNDIDNNKELVAYVVSKDKEIKDKVIDYVSSCMPNYMVPSHVVVLESIPLNINGKVDKRALPNIDITQNIVSYVAPTNEIESSVCKSFAEVFNLEKVGINDDFLKLGGDSLKAIKIISTLKNSNITSIQIFKLRTVKNIAQKIAESSELDNLVSGKYKKKI